MRKRKQINMYEFLTSKSYTLRPKNVANEGSFSILSWKNSVTSSTNGQVDFSNPLESKFELCRFLLCRQQVRTDFRCLVVGDRRVSRRVDNVSISSRCVINALREALQVLHMSSGEV